MIWNQSQKLELKHEIYLSMYINMFLWVMNEYGYKKTNVIVFFVS